MTPHEYIERLRGALRFYAIMEEHAREVVIKTVIDDDGGEKAREALALPVPEVDIEKGAKIIKDIFRGTISAERMTKETNITICDVAVSDIFLRKFGDELGKLAVQKLIEIWGLKGR